MAKMKVIYKILPSDVRKETLEAIIPKIKALEDKYNFKLESYAIEPIAFGLNSLKVLIAVAEEDQTILDTLEKEILSIDEVDSIEVIGMSRS